MMLQLYKYCFYTFFKIFFIAFFGLEAREVVDIIRSSKVEHFMVVQPYTSKHFQGYLVVYFGTLLRVFSCILLDTLKGAQLYTFEHS